MTSTFRIHTRNEAQLSARAAQGFDCFATAFSRPRKTAHIAAPIMLLLASACAPIISNTHVEGDRSSVAQLVGQWEGTYNSRDTGRSGFITFNLRAGTDTAQGDVIMTPRANDASPNYTGNEPPRASQQLSQILTIRFVRANGDEVLGMLDPYNDPVCGCSLVTRFRGRLRGDSIEGKFETGSAEIFHRNSGGEWSVKRVPVAAAPRSK